MSKAGKARISQCMIVKNEEKNIERALSWGKGVVSEQIVVDTGSTDRTVEIARRMGAKVYEFQWIDDFAAAKNYAIEKAGYEWVALLDADEYFSGEDAGKLLDYVEKLQDTQINGVVTAWIHMSNEGQVLGVDTQIRVFRNHPAIRYKRRIHETLVSFSPDVPLNAIDANELSIFHTGYGALEKKEKLGSKRNLRLIEKELEENPDDYEMWGYLGNEYDSMGQEDEAEKAYRRSMALMPEQPEEFDILATKVYLRLLNLLTTGSKKEDESAILKVYQEAVKRRPKEADYDYLLGRYLAEKGRYEEAEKHLRQAFGMLEQYGNTGKAMALSGEIMKAYEMLAICCFNNGDLAGCVQLTTALLKENPYLMSTAVVMLSAFSKDKNSRAEDVAVFLGRSFYNLGTLKDRLFLLRAAISANYGAMVQVLKGTFAAEEMAAVRQALGTAWEKDHEKGLRMVLFYSSVESFNFFTDQLSAELKRRGHEIFILDLRNSREEGGIHSYAEFNKFIEKKVDAAICFDALAVRDSDFVKLWDHHDAVVVDILMDPPLRFQPAFDNPPKKYRLFCCDREHVEYVRTYFAHIDVAFMPHVGVMPGKDRPVIPFERRTYDILFCGTYYSPHGKFSEIEQVCPKGSDAYKLYEGVFDNLKKDSSLSIWKAFLLTRDQYGWDIPGETLRQMLYGCNCIDWAIRMHQRERVVTALAESGLNLYLLGRGWENHPSTGYANVHRIEDRIPYGDTLAYMADARINLNVMPGFKGGTHDRIFNTLLQHSLPLTDSSTWIDENFTDGVDIRLYDLDHLERLPHIAREILECQEQTQAMIERGYEKVAEGLTWSHCADWILEAVGER